MNLDYPIQFIILIQPVFWEAVLTYDWVQIGERWRSVFYAYFTAIIYVLLRSGWGHAYYTNSLLILYVGMIMIAVYGYTHRFTFKEALALGVLTVFLNSYYWEIPLHAADIINWLMGPSGVPFWMFAQFLRLYPVFYLRRAFKINWGYLKTGLWISSGIMLLRFYVLPNRWGFYIWSVNRVICLWCLIATILEAPRKSLNKEETEN